MPQQVRVRRRKPAPQRVRLGERRKKRRVIFSWVLGVLVLMLVASVLYLLRLPEVTIQQVSVGGTYYTSAEDVAASVESELDKNGFHIVPLRSIFFYSKDDIAERVLEDFTYIRSVEVSRSPLFSTELVVQVEERVAYGIWCTEGTESCYFFDASGVIYAPADSFAEWEIFYGGVDENREVLGQVFMEGKVEWLRELLNFMTQREFDPYIVRIKSDGDITITLRERWDVLLSSEQQPESVVSALESALESESLRENRESIQYIDVRYGNRVYFKVVE